MTFGSYFPGPGFVFDFIHDLFDFGIENLGNYYKFFMLYDPGPGILLDYPKPLLDDFPILYDLCSKDDRFILYFSGPGNDIICL